MHQNDQSYLKWQNGSLVVFSLAHIPSANTWEGGNQDIFVSDFWALFYVVHLLFKANFFRPLMAEVLNHIQCVY